MFYYFLFNSGKNYISYNRIYVYMQSSSKDIAHYKVEERILLHLMDYTDYEDAVEVPEAVTQPGIAGSVWIQRSAVPRATNNLIEKGLAVTKKAHVEGLKRRRKVYFLTHEGLKEANRLLDELKGIEPELEFPDGTVRKEALPVILEYVNDYLQANPGIKDTLGEMDKDRFDLLDLANFLSKEDIVERRFQGMIDVLLEQTSSHGEKKMKKTRRQSREGVKSSGLLEPLKRPEVFVGRLEELEKVLGWINDATTRLIAVYGIAGIGKTTFINKLVHDELPKKWNVFYYRIHKWDTSRDIYFDLASCLEKTGTKLRKGEDINELGAMRRELISCLEEVPPILLIFDDVHEADENVNDLITMLNELTALKKDLKIVLASRDQVNVYSEAQVTTGMVKELHLTGLKEKGVKELLTRLGLDLDIEGMEPIMSNGHPLIIQIISHTGYGDREVGAFAHIEHFIDEEILSRLDGKEKHLLQYLSTYRCRVPYEAFLFENLSDKGERDFKDMRVEDVNSLKLPKKLFSWDNRTLFSLVKKGLILESGKAYEIHELVKNVVFDHITPTEGRWYHIAVAQTHLDQVKHNNETDFHLCESVHHLGRAGAYRALVELVYHRLGAVAHSGRAEPAAGSVRDALASDASDNMFGPEDLLKAYVSLGHLYYVMARYDQSQELLQKAEDMLETDHKDWMMVAYELGRIFTKKRQCDTARSYLEQCLELPKERLDLWKVHSAIGDTYWMEGRYKEATLHYKMASTVFEREHQLPQKLQESIDGAIETADQDLDAATVMYEKAIDGLKQYLDHESEPMNITPIGDFYLKLLFSINAQKDTQA